MTLNEPLLPVNSAAAAAEGTPGGAAATTGAATATATAAATAAASAGVSRQTSSNGSSFIVENDDDGRRGGAAANDDNTLKCVFNLLKVLLGAGMMALAKAFWIIGLVPAVAGMLVILLVSYYTISHGLIEASEEYAAASYGDLARRALGRRARGALHAAVFVTCWVLEVVFLVILGDILVGAQGPSTAGCQGLLSEVAALAGLPPPPCSRPLALAVVCAAGLLPLGMLRRMDALAALNVAGVAANGLLAALMVALLAAAARAGAASPPPLWPRWGELVAAGGGSRLSAALLLASAAPVLLNCFACHQSVHPLAAALRPRTARRARLVVAAALGAAGAIYAAVAACACAVFGEGLHDDVLADVSRARMAPLLGAPAAAAASLAVRLGYVASLSGSFVLLLWPLRQVLADALLGGQAALGAWWAPATAALTLSAYATACFLPGIWGALTLVGATATTVQSWIVPALLTLALEARRAKRGAGRGGWRRAAHRGAAWALLVLGCLMFFNAFVDAWWRRQSPPGNAEGGGGGGDDGGDGGDGDGLAAVMAGWGRRRWR